MEESKSKKVNIIRICIFCLIILSLSYFVIESLTRQKVEEKNRYSNQETIYFEEVGRYGIAYTALNNAYRGTGVNTGVELILEYPPNSDEILSKIPSNIVSRINNMSGAVLKFDGTVKKAWITTMVSSDTFGSNDILVIKPDGSYQVIYKGSAQTLPINITQSGWYYVSILDAPVQPQLAWAITAVYENSNLPKRYLSINYAPYVIWGYEDENYRDILSIDFSGAFATAFKDKFELFGLVIAGGASGWSIKGETEDKLEVKLSDGTYKQLYSNRYNTMDSSKWHFLDRTNTDFFNGNFYTYSDVYTLSMTSHFPNSKRGGELDIFHEDIDKSYFGNKDVAGYRITKIGNDAIVPQLFGIARDLVYPNMTINSEITNQTLNKLIENEKVHIKIDVKNNSSAENRPAYKSTITYKLDNALSNVENLVVKVDGVNSGIVPTYNSATNEVIISNIAKIATNQVVTLEYDATVNSNIRNKGGINTNVQLPINVNVKAYSVDINSLNSTYQSKYSNSYNETKGIVNVTGVYTSKAGGLEVKYIDEITGEEIGEIETKEGMQGEEYTTEAKNIEGYGIVETPTNATGTMQQEKITVIYKYRKLSKVIVKYVDVISNTEVDKEEVEYKEGDSFTVETKEINGYRVVETPENVSGTMGRENIEVTIGCKKIAGGVEVKYIDEVTGEEIDAKETKTGLEKDKYETEAKEITGYELVNIPANKIGEMTEEKITVTYKYRKLSKVITKYIDMNSNTEIEKEEKTYKEGDNYTTQSKEIDGYKLIESPENANGVVGREDIEVIYGYKKIAGGIEVKYIDEITKEEISTAEHYVGLEKDRYDTEEKEIEGYELTVTPTNKTGEMTVEKITVTYEYRKLSKVTVKYIDLNNNTEIEKEDRTYKEGDKYTIESKEINNYKLIETPENINGTMGRENIEVTFGYKKIAGGVEVKYIDEVTNEEIETKDTIEGLEKDKYTTEEKEIEGYELVNIPTNKTGEMTVEKIEVTYKYRKLSKVTVKYIDLNNNIEIEKEENEYKEGDNYTTQSKKIDNYKLVETPENANGVVEREDIEVIYGYKKIAGGIEVKYIDEITREEIATSEHQVGLEKDRYETESKEIEGYELTVTPTNKTGEMTVEKITVTYEYRKLSKVTVKYVDLNSGEEIAREENEYKEGDSYTTQSKEINGYKLVQTPENVNGVVEREDIEVIYGYKKISKGVEVKYIDEVTGEEIDVKETIEGLEKDKYETEAKEISGYELTVTPTNKTGEMTVEKITVIYKYRKLSKVTVKYIDLNNNTEIEKVENVYKEGENYTTESKEINGYKLVETPENANGVVKREDIEVIYGYKKIAGGVIVKHIDKGNNEVIKEEKIEGVIGEKYSTRKLDLEKYNYIEVVGNVEGELGEESIEVSYYYEKKQAIVEVIYEDENGKEIYKEIMEGKVGEKYKVEVKDIENYKIVEEPKNIDGIYGVDEIVVKFIVEKIKVKVEINIVDEKGNIIEVIEKEGYIGDKEEIELPEIDGYYPEEKSIFVEYGKENNVNVVYKKKLFDLPNTSDMNIYLYIGIFIISIIIICILITIRVKTRKNM